MTSIARLSGILQTLFFVEANQLACRVRRAKEMSSSPIPSRRACQAVASDPDCRLPPNVPQSYHL